MQLLASVQRIWTFGGARWPAVALRMRFTRKATGTDVSHSLFWYFTLFDSARIHAAAAGDVPLAALQLCAVVPVQFNVSQYICLLLYLML
jgi:hypothetical protein